jgi:hypothetical protein
VSIRAVSATGEDRACGTAASHAVDVVDSARVTIAELRAAGGSTSFVRRGEAAIRIADVPEGGAVLVRHAHAAYAPVGFLVEEVDGAAGGRERVELQNDTGSYNDTAVLLRNASGVRVAGGLFVASSVTGIHLESTTTGNQLLRNTIGRYPFYPDAIDVVDDGNGNCWQGNRFTVGTVVQGPCS